MGAPSPGKVPVTFELPKERAVILNQRAQRLDWSRSQYVNAILNLWFEAGQPPVNEGDVGNEPKTAQKRRNK